MNVATIGIQTVTPQGTERMQPPAPERDGDADDGASKALIQSPPAPGTGTLVDKTV